MKLDYEKEGTYALRHKIRYICDDDNDLVDKYLAYLEGIDSEHDELILEIIKQQHYDIKFLGKKRKYISKNAILLAQKIKAELDEDCYPQIEVCGTKGYMSQGCWSWCMKLIPPGATMEIGSADSVRVCLQKSREFTTSDYDSEIFAEKKDRKKK